MNEKESWQLIGAFVVLFVTGLFLGMIIMSNYDDREAIQHGYMQHNPVTGKVEWR